MTIERSRLAPLADHLAFLYPGGAGDLYARLERMLADFAARHPGLAEPAADRVSERDAVLITYGDQVRAPGEAPLATLRRFLCDRVGDAVTGVHLLPFYPYTSDDGFSVVDYLEVDPALGDWADVEAIGRDYRLMFDAVINHVSAESAWFQRFLRGDPGTRGYFLTEDPATDLSAVVRPRTTPLLTRFETARGPEHVWTTFSADQIDLNYGNPEVLFEITRVLLEYVARGAEILRLDAVTYLWKEVGTSCVHLPRTHEVLRFFRSVMDLVAPNVVLLTETNVPHAENVAYFGDGRGEAQMVYNFALPPLVLHAVLSGSARELARWAAELATPSAETCFFNFLASHDGIGVRAVEGLLTPAEVGRMVEAVLGHGGLVSYKTNSDGTQSPYELNISYFDALSDPGAGEPLGLALDRFLAAHAVMLALAGVPGIYVHSLLGSRSFHDGVRATGMNRSINREKLELAALEAELDDPAGLRRATLARFGDLLRARRAEPAFHPQAPQEILAAPDPVFALRRAGPGGQTVTCLQNLGAAPVDVRLDPAPGPGAVDLLTKKEVTAGGAIRLASYGVLWLKESGERS